MRYAYGRGSPPNVAACQRTSRAASSAVVQNVARKTSPAADRELRLRGRRRAAPRRRRDPACRSSPGFASTKPSRVARAASGIGWNATILRRGKRGASASNRSSAVRVPPNARAGLSVGTRRLRRGPAAGVASRFGATRWSSATPSRPSREAAAAALALLDADVGPGAGAPRIASRTPRARAVSRPERRTVWRIVGTTAVYRPRPVALAPFPGQPVRGLSSVMARPIGRRVRGVRAVRRRRARSPSVVVVGDLMLDVGRDPVPAARARDRRPGHGRAAPGRLGGEHGALAGPARRAVDARLRGRSRPGRTGARRGDPRRRGDRPADPRRRQADRPDRRRRDVRRRALVRRRPRRRRRAAPGRPQAGLVRASTWSTSRPTR